MAPLESAQFETYSNFWIAPSKRSLSKFQMILPRETLGFIYMDKVYCKGHLLNKLYDDVKNCDDMKNYDDVKNYDDMKNHDDV